MYSASESIMDNLLDHGLSCENRKTGLGSGTLKLVNKRKKIAITDLVSNVLHVPKLSSILLSVTNLLEKSLSVQFKDAICSIINSADEKVKAAAVLAEKWKSF